MGGYDGMAGGVVEKMLQHGRYAILLRPQVVEDLSEQQRNYAQRQLARGTTPTPAGKVLLDSWCPEPLVEYLGSQPPRWVSVEPFYLDRFAVTNAEFQMFLDDGAYSHTSFWDPRAVPRVREFVDQTAHPGPRGWSGGRFKEGLERHPVVGINWFEADAYARWVGKRLPTDAEWVKAACWPIESEIGLPLQRKYPWGDGMDASKANLWSSGRRATAAVDDYAEGVSAAGSYQLVGNVWEWTASTVTATVNGQPVAWSATLKSLRGGSFDTYFENQATCQFQSADSPFARRDNVGFRCAIGDCDLVAAEGEAEIPAADALQSEPRTVE
jgi:iron(II)-dependent oxidoreductase